MERVNFRVNQDGKAEKQVLTFDCCTYIEINILKIKHYLENKGIVFKARWFVLPDKTRAQPLFESFHAKIMVIFVFHQAVQTISL